MEVREPLADSRAPQPLHLGLGPSLWSSCPRLVWDPRVGPRCLRRLRQPPSLGVGVASEASWQPFWGAGQLNRCRQCPTQVLPGVGWVWA